MFDLLKAPFPWFGGKSRIAPIVWSRLGNVPNFVEPFAGSLAILLGRPHDPGIETVNDKDGLVSNFWRSVQHAPDAVAHYAHWPVNENDLHARHIWLIHQLADLVPKLEGDPDYYDAKIAGWWVWGICCWIGGEFCSGKGPWQVDNDNRLVHLSNAGRGVDRKLVHLGNAGQGVHRRRVHLGNAGRGVHRQRVHLGNAGQGVHRKHGGLFEWMQAIANRLRYVRVACGDWERVCGPSVTVQHGLTGVFLDPPYRRELRDANIYRQEDGNLNDRIYDWCLAWGDHPRMRIALCGLEGEYEMPESWAKVEWKARGGYGNRGDSDAPTAHIERVWFSPHCLKPQGAQLSLFS